MGSLKWPARVLLAVGAILAAGGPRLHAQGPSTAPLAEVSIEDLLNIQVTSASRRQQRTGDVAAAIFVISQDDIRRSGLTSIPDLLRLAPGVDVGQVNSNNWAVSVRGFNGSYANKLLVLVDGRTIYNRIFSGVLWDAQALMVDDIDRIEVIRGPGAAMWGANAVNGVINIVTRNTAQTLGGLLRIQGGGNGEQAAGRYGGTVGSATYRVLAQWTGRNQSLLRPGTGANDGSNNLTTGFRLDRSGVADTLTLQGGFSGGRSLPLRANLDPETSVRSPIAREPSIAYGAHLLGGWTHTRPGGASLKVQSFVDVIERREPIGINTQRILDLDTQYHTAVGARQELVAGGGLRSYHDTSAPEGGFGITPLSDNSSLLTAFVQDEIGLFDRRLAVIVGSQVQYDSNAGGGLQPTARLMYKPASAHRIWAATSRALRTPARTDRGVRIDFPPVPAGLSLPLAVTLLGNPEFETETFVDTELGYRVETPQGSVDVTGFLGWYDHLSTREQAPPSVALFPSPRIVVASRLGNELAARTRGLEVAGRWSPLAALRFDGSYTAFRATPRLASVSTDPAAVVADWSAPQTKWQLSAAVIAGPRATVNVAVSHVGRLVQLQVNSYTRADVTAEWRLNDRLSLMAIGQNLLDPAHPEFADNTRLLQATQVRRSAGLRLRWTFL